MSPLPNMNSEGSAAASIQTLPSHTQANDTKPCSITHTTVPAAYHIKAEDFVAKVEASVENFFPNHAYRCKKVHTLLLSWEDDDLGVEK